jgi:DNA-binding SARP family transcriptional activator
MNPEADWWTDVEEFERLVTSPAGDSGSGLAESEGQRLRAAVALYRGDLCEGDEDAWCLSEKERLQALFRSALERAGGCCARCGDWAGAIAWYERLLRFDPLREQAHRELMRYHYLTGNRAAALTQFAKLVQLLASELQVEPMPETMDLCASIRAGRSLPPP